LQDQFKNKGSKFNKKRNLSHSEDDESDLQSSNAGSQKITMEAYFMMWANFENRSE
jgi:hypothetical protein